MSFSKSRDNLGYFITVYPPVLPEYTTEVVYLLG